MKHFLFITVFAFLLFNCSSSTKVKSFNNTFTPEGKPKFYQTTTNTALHFFFGLLPIHEVFGNSSFDKTLDDFTSNAVKNKATKVHIIQRETTRYWYVVLPFTILLTPVTTELTGYVME